MNLQKKILLISFISLFIIITSIFVSWRYGEYIEEEHYKSSVLDGQYILWKNVIDQHHSRMKYESKRIMRNKNLTQGLWKKELRIVKESAAYDYNGLSGSAIIKNLMIFNSKGDSVFSSDELEVEKYRNISLEVLNRKKYFYDIIKNEHGHGEIIFAFPLYYKNIIVGSGIFIQSLESSVLDYDKATNSNTYLLTSSGHKYIGQNSKLYESLFNFIPKDFMKNSLLYILDQNKRYVLSIIPIKNRKNEPVSILVSIKNDVNNFSKIKNFQNKLYIFIVIVLFLTILLWSFILRKTISSINNTFKILSQNEKLEAKVFERTEELKIALDQAKSAGRAKSAFLANMSHELRTPLNAIIGYSDMLCEDVENMGINQVKDDLNKIHRSGVHLLSLIQDILDISKIEAGKMELHNTKFNIEDMVQTVMTIAKPLAQKNKNKIILSNREFIGEIVCDEGKLRQSLLNLLSNACKFTENGHVTLGYYREQKSHTSATYLIFFVSDTGCGIPKSNQEKLFSAFSQADSSISKEFGGTGLGLVISRQFCKLMGGDVYMESVVGKGTIFEIKIPLRTSIGSTGEEKSCLAVDELENISVSS